MHEELSVKRGSLTLKYLFFEAREKKYDKLAPDCAEIAMPITWFFLFPKKISDSAFM